MLQRVRWSLEPAALGSGGDAGVHAPLHVPPPLLHVPPPASWTNLTTVIYTHDMIRQLRGSEQCGR